MQLYLNLRGGMNEGESMHRSKHTANFLPLSRLFFSLLLVLFFSRSPLAILNENFPNIFLNWGLLGNDVDCVMFQVNSKVNTRD